MRVLLLGVAIVVSVGMGAAATEWRVPTDFPTPAACIAGAAPGDTCVLQPGAHPGFVVPPGKPNMTIISSNGAFATTITGPIFINANGVTLGRAGQGFFIGGFGVTIQASENITIEDSIITGNAGPGVLVSTPGAVRTVRFVDLQVRSNGGGGIIFANGGSADNVVILGGAIETNAGGPGIGFAVGGSVRRLQISNTRITANPAGIVFAGPTNDIEDSEFSNVFVQGSAGPGVAFANAGRVMGVIVSGSNISSNMADNVVFANALVADVAFENNTIESAAGNGVNFSNAGAVEDTAFRNNTIQRNGANGVLFFNAGDVDGLQIVNSNLRNNGLHNLFINHVGANDFSVGPVTIDGGVVDQASDNGIRIVTVMSDIVALTLRNVQVSKNGGMGVCLRTNGGSIADVKIDRAAIKENQGGVGTTACDGTPAAIGSGVELITLTANIGPTEVTESTFANNGGFGLRLQSLGFGGGMGDVGPVTVRNSTFEQNGTRAPAGLGSGFTARGRSVHDISINPTVASNNNDHGVDIQATSDITNVTITGGEFSNNDRNVDTIGAGINLSATQRLSGLRVSGAKLIGNAKGARVQAAPWGEHPRGRMIFGGPLCYTTCMRFPKVRLNRQQRELYAQRITEVGNLAVAALLLGQVIAGEFRVDWTLWGVTIWVASYIVGGILLRQRGSKDE
jgi:hypothetical protein